jgi:phosphoglycerol transferase MdoB-like AlkP superfamily enzyme
MKGSSEPVADLIGAITANIYMLLIIAVFVARILGLLEISRWIGFTSSLVIFPLLYLFIVGLRTSRRKIYFAWLALMILFVLFELIIDQILRVDLRSQQSSVIPYVMFFFAATGGMIGVASQAGKTWAITTVIIFLIMATLAFLQRGITGL